MQTSRRLILKNDRGVVLILVALLLIVFLGIGALTVDSGVLYVGKGELQKAADAAALAGARDLYLANGASVNTGVNNIATSVATRNRTLGGLAVEVRPDEVQRGHWSFGLGNLPRGFTPNDSTTAINLTFFSTRELDENPDFINAIRVVARRDTVVLPSFFSRIYGHLGFQLQAEAVGYIGYAGSVDVDEIDYPIMLCREAVIKQTADGEKVDCTTGRVLSSDQTARWTNFEQPCGGAANAASVNQQMNPCGRGNSEQIFFGVGTTTTRGVQANNVDRLRNCWLGAGLDTHAVPRGQGQGTVNFPAEPWPIKLLVVDCVNDASPTCVQTTGVVVVNVMWISNPSNASYAPMRMAGPPGYETWENSNPDPQVRWASFANHFNLRNENGTMAVLEPGAFTAYLHMDCDIHEPTGGTGGVNYGVMARIPVLVQ